MYVVEYIHKGQKLREETINSPEEIRRKFIQEGKTILSIKKKLVFKTVPKAEVIAFLTAMGDLTAAGVPMTKALDSVIKSFDSKQSSLPPMLKKIRDAVANGVPIAEAMESYQHVFGRTVLAMIQAGEHSGKMAETFATSADYIEQQDEVNKEMWRKLVGPLAALTFGIVSLLVNSTVIIPLFMKGPLFQNANRGGHDLAYYCIEILKAMKLVVPTGLAAVAGLIVLAFFMYKHQQEEVEKKIIMIPGLKEFIFYRAYFVAFASLAKLMEFGVKSDEALEIVEKSAGFIIIKRQFQAARAAIREGQSFAKGLTSLTPVERTMFDTAQSQVSVHKNFARIAKRYHYLYLQKIRSIAPKIKAIVGLMTVVILILEFMGILLPYGKTMSSIK